MSIKIANQLKTIRESSLPPDRRESWHLELSHIESRIAITTSGAQKLRLIRKWLRELEIFLSAPAQEDAGESHGRKKTVAKAGTHGNRRTGKDLDD